MKRLIYLLILFVISIFVILWIDFEFIPHIPINGDYNKINNLFHGLFLAYITSFIFYLIVVFLKEHNDKKNLRKYLREKIGEINNLVNSLIAEIQMVDEKKFKNEYPSKEELAERMKKLNLSSIIKSPRIHPITYENYFREHSKTVQSKLDRILIHLPYLDTKFVDKINQVYDCQFFTNILTLANSKDITEYITKSLRNEPGINLSGVNFATAYTEPIINYFEHIKELNKYSP